MASPFVVVLSRHLRACLALPWLLGATTAACVSFDEAVTQQLAGSTLTAAPLQVAADGNEAATVTLTVPNLRAAPPANLQVAFVSDLAGSGIDVPSQVTDANGQAQVTVRSRVPGTATVRAFLGGKDGSLIPAAARVTFTAASIPLTLAASPTVVVADGAQAANITVILRDASGNPAGNVAVSLAFADADAGIGAVLGASSLATDAAGTAVTSFRATTTGSRTLDVTAGALRWQTTVTFVPGAAAAATSSVVASPNVRVADGAQVANVQLVVRDAQGNAVPDAPVSLASSNVGVAFAAADGNTDANGAFATTLTSTRSGATTLTASVGPMTTTTQVTFVAGPVDAVASSLVPAAAGVSNDGTPLMATATLRDAYANGVAGQAVTFTSPGADVTLSPPGAQTSDANGQVQITASSLTAQKTKLVATAGAVTLQANVTFAAPGAPFAGTSQLDVTPPSGVIANGNAVAAISVTARDINGAAVAGGNVRLTTPGYGARFTPSIGLTDASGHFAASMASTLSGNRPITVQLDGLALAGNAGFVGGPNPCPSTLALGAYPMLASVGGGYLAMADLNGDGNVDVVSVDANKNVRIALNNGRTQFVDRTLDLQGAQAVAVAARDVVGDANVDVVVLTRSPDSVWIWQGLGDGNFVSYAAGATAANPNAMALGDYNNDGLVDVAVIGSGQNVVIHDQLRTNVAITRALPMGATAGALVAGDLDRDGITDLVIAYASIEQVVSYVHPTSPAAVVKTTSNQSWKATLLALADFTGDGILDRVVAQRGGQNVGVARGVGDGSFADMGAPGIYLPAADSPQALALGDVTGDGMVDMLLAVSGNTLLYQGKGAAGFADERRYAAPTGSHAGMVLVDVDGDGVRDVARQSDQWLSYAVSDRAGNFLLPSSNRLDNVAFVAVADLDRDGYVDALVAQGDNRQAAFYYGSAQGIDVTAPSSVAQGGAVPAALLLDVNGDGNLDYVSILRDGAAVETFLSTGSRTFNTIGRSATFSDPLAGVAGDFDGDGKVDLAIAGSGNVLGVMRNQGASLSLVAPQTSLAVSPNAVAAADLNGDGLLDVLVTYAASDKSGVVPLLNQGNFVFAAGTPIEVAGAAWQVGTGDLDGDGLVDLALAYGEQLQLAYGNGQGGFVAAPQVHLPSGLHYRTALIDDVDGDGAAEIVLSGDAGVGLLLLRRNDGGTWVQTTYLGSGYAQPQLVAGRFSARNRKDLLASGGGFVSLYANTGCR